MTIVRRSDMNRGEIRRAVGQWKCVGMFGYGQGRAVAEFGEQAEDKLICHQLCPRTDKCQDKHRRGMDVRFPSLAQIVKKTAIEAQAAGRPLVKTVVAAMNVAVGTGNIEAIMVRDGLKRYSASGMTDHYIYGQLENFHKGLQKKDPKEPIDSGYQQTALISPDNPYTKELEELLSVVPDE